MKLTKTKKIILLGATLAALTTSIVTPIVLLNKDENNDEKDINKVFKILEEKNDKTIILASDSTKKIIANNEEKIITKLKELIGSENLKEIKIEVTMNQDQNISTTAQKIIIKLTKNEISRQIKDFLVKRNFTANEDIIAIKNILDAKNDNDLIITLPSNSTGNIIGNTSNKDTIEKKLRMLIDPSNKSGEANHASLRGVTIEILMNNDVPISTTPQNIIVSISKTGGTTLRTTKTFQVKRHFTADEDIIAIKDILDTKTGNDLIINLPDDSSGSIVTNNRNAIIKKIRKLIDPSNTNGEANHTSLRGTSIEIAANDPSISTTPKNILVFITKDGGTTLRTTKTFQVKRGFTNAQKITNYFAILDNRALNIYANFSILNSQQKILTAIKTWLQVNDPNLWTIELQNLITTDSSETKTSITRGGPTVTYSIAYNDNSGNPQKVDLNINYYYTNAEKITNYFANNTKKNITIVGGNALNTKAKILTAIKIHLANDDSVLWTNKLQSLITTHSSETETSITRDGPTITYSIAYDDQSGITQKVDLTINHVSTTKK